MSWSDFRRFLREEKRWWLTPIVVVLLVAAALLLFLSPDSGLAPFLYPN